MTSPLLQAPAGCGCGGGCDCGCCRGVSDRTPVDVANPPGLSAIAYRVGTHATFKASMLARLSSAGEPALVGLRTRDDDDLSIALLDAWATVADILAFYQERIANECYLRTATERRSLLELSRLIGYELSPGVAAATVLAFTVDQTTSGAVPIPAGTKVQSVPAPGQVPQTFETAQPIDARAEWNSIRVRQTQAQPLSTTMDQVVLSGVALNLRKGDALLIAASGDTKVRWIADLTIDRSTQTTTVKLAPVGGGGPSKQLVYQMVKTAGTGAAELAQFTDQGSVPQRAVEMIARVNSVPQREIEAVFAGQRQRQNVQPPGDGVYAFRVRAAVFGHNAPDHAFLTQVNANVKPDDPDDATLGLAATGFDVDLDGSFPGIVPQSFVAIVDRETGDAFPHQVTERAEGSRARFAISGTVTSLILDSANDLAGLTVRGTTVLGQSEPLTPAELPITDPVAGGTLTLDGAFLDLGAGQLVVVAGVPKVDGDVPCETATIATADLSGGYTVLTLATALQGTYQRPTVTVRANVVRATHGETVHEIVGSGDAGQAYPRFRLRQAPLTYVSSPKATGRQTTLTLRVNDIEWHEVPTLYGRGPRDRVFYTRQDDDHKTTVYAGDGATGARFPSGVENVTATYRKGIGLGGLVEAGQLSLLMSRPLGVRAVTNPEPATGAADPESLADARGNAPVTVRTLDRVVSLRDYEDFARAFGGIGKALATWTWSGDTRGVFLTVAGMGGQPVPADGEVAANLLTALRGSGDPFLGVRVASFQPAFFRVTARVAVQPEYLPDRVLDAVQTALGSAFSFETRAFGQPVALSQVEAVIQGVDGVAAVLMDGFARFDDQTAPPVSQRLAAAAPQPGSDAGTVVAAELLLLDPSGATLSPLT